jgi:hypothetical protein
MDMRRVSVVLLLLLIAALAPTAAQAASCLTTMPIDEVISESGDADGFAATGMTVSRGIDPEPFDVTVLGVLDDGVSPGVDMIIVEADSPALDRAGGIWAGMSGSPVYADDGRLIGAVAYGMSFGPSKIGGLAVADDMGRILDRPVAATANALRAPAALRQKMVASGAVTGRQAASGFERLPIPLSVSGLNSGRLKAFAGRLPGNERFMPYAAGAAAPAAGDPAEIVPGGNFAAALSYGDVSAAGVGTTTAVCGDQVVAFGHPMNFDGPTALSAHTARAITIQDDPAGVPFKLANVGGVVGTLDQDRLSGIRAILGDAPTPIPVTSTVNDEDPARSTYINRTQDSPDIAAFHLLANIDRVADRLGAGRAEVNWTLTGTAGGKHFSLSRNNRFADRFDFSIVPADDLFGHLLTLVENPFSDVEFTGLTVDATTQDEYRAYRIDGIEQRVGAEWEPIDPDGGLSVQPGALLRLRVLLAQERSTTAVAPVEVALRVPADAAGREGSLEISGGGGGDDGEEGFAAEAGGEPQSFEELVDALRTAPRNDDVVASLQFFSESGSTGPATVRKRVAEVVSGGLGVPVLVEGGEEPPPDCEVTPCEEPPLGSPPRVTLGGKSALKLATALKRGFKVTLRTSEAGRATIKAYVDRKTARRLKIKKNAKGAVVVAAATKRVHSGRNTVKLVFTKKARKRLRRASRVKLSVRATIRSVEGNRATDRFNLTLKRKLR